MSIALPPLPPFITRYTGPDDISDSEDTLQFPSDIEIAIAKSAPSKELPSIVDQAVSYHESIDPQAHSRREIIGISLLGPTDIDAAIKRSEEGVKASKFPELSALVTDDEKSLEYTVIQQEFENEFPCEESTTSDGCSCLGSGIPETRSYGRQVPGRNP